jgi:hypothetical protein
MLADIGIAVLLLVGVYCFLALVGFRTSLLTRRSTRRAEDLYGQFADSPRQQRKYARERGGTWKDDAGSHSPPLN